MSWLDRIQDAAYTPPSGTRLSFSYEDVSLEIEKRTAAFNFPDADGTLVQDNGKSGRRYPMRLFFYGADYDTEAGTFLEALLETGAGKLEHPIYGTKTVVPFGRIRRRDDLKTGANQAIFDVTFWETIGTAYPTGQTDAYSDVSAAVDDYNDAAATEFDELASLDTAVEQSVLKSAYQSLLDSAKSGLQTIADTQAEVAAYFNEVYDSIDTGLDTLVSDPVTLAYQTMLLIQSPAQALSSFSATLSAYSDLATSLISGDGAVVSDSNEFHASDVYASTYVSASVSAAINKTFDTKAGALEAAEDLLDFFDEVRDWREANFEALGEIDTGAGYQALQNAVSLAAGFLVELSFSLKQERSVVLDRSRTIIDLAAEYYGEIDEQLDFIINSNNLSGSEILEMPKGREFVYYV